MLANSAREALEREDPSKAPQATPSLGGQVYTLSKAQKQKESPQNQVRVNPESFQSQPGIAPESPHNQPSPLETPG
jgi:hypothetical protein